MDSTLNDAMFGSLEFVVWFIPVLGMTLNCIYPPPQGTNNVPAPVLSSDKEGRFARWWRYAGSKRPRRLPRCSRCHDVEQTYTGRSGQTVGESRWRGHGTHTDIDPCFSPNILFNQTRWSICFKMLMV